MTIAESMVSVMNDADRVFKLVLFTPNPVSNLNECVDYARSKDADLIIVQAESDIPERSVFHIFNKPGTGVTAKQIAEMLGGTGGGHDGNCGVIYSLSTEMKVETVLRATLQI